MNVRFIAARAKSLTLRLLQDDAGGELIETALIIGLISIVAIGVMGKLGTKVLLRWSDIYDQL